MGRAVLVGWAVLVAAVIAAVPLAMWRRLPEPMAVHWSGAAPDGAMSRTAGLAGLLAVWVGVVALVVAADVYGNRPYAPGRGRRVALPVLAGVGVLFAGLEVWTVWANLDRADWRDAAHIGWPFALPLLAGLAAGVAAWVVDRRIAPPEAPPYAGDRPCLDLRPGERVSWTGVVVNRAMTWSGAVLGIVCAAGVALTAAGPWRPPLPALLALMLAGGALLAFGRVRVTADARGLRIVFGPFGWPVQHVALDRITDVAVEELRPMEVGGWGYRGLPGSAAVMLRGGACLVVRYDGGRSRLIVSVDGADEAAAVLNVLRPAGV